MCSKHTKPQQQAIYLLSMRKLKGIHHCVALDEQKKYLQAVLFSFIVQQQCEHGGGVQRDAEGRRASESKQGVNKKQM